MKDPQQNPTRIDEIIKKAQDDGAFDNLAGTGKPIPGAGKPDDELWWFRSWVKRNRQSEEDGTE